MIKVPKETKVLKDLLVFRVDLEHRANVEQLVQLVNQELKALRVPLDLEVCPDPLALVVLRVTQELKDLKALVVIKDLWVLLESREHPVLVV